MIHTPVLLDECIRELNIKPNGLYVDGTLGRAGHALELAKRLVTGKLIAIDRDLEAIDESKKIFKAHGVFDKVILVHANFMELNSVLAENGIKAVDGMLFDLGVSSPQLDDSKRGFSYMNNTLLDMRMNRDDELTAYEIVNNRTQDELQRIFFEYGEERYSKSIARAIVKRREKAPIETTYELNDLILSAIPGKARREPQHPSKRCFQALRISVNDELNSISKLLAAIPDCLNKYGRVCILCFHSLEDRLVKRAFSDYATKCICSKELPVCVCGVKPIMKIVTKKPIIPSDRELLQNPRARSAKLRVAEKL